MAAFEVIMDGKICGRVDPRDTTDDLVSRKLLRRAVSPNQGDMRVKLDRQHCFLVENTATSPHPDMERWTTKTRPALIELTYPAEIEAACTCKRTKDSPWSLSAGRLSGRLLSIRRPDAEGTWG